MSRRSPGMLIRAARQRAGLTQAQLARRAGTTQAAISRIEGDGHSPTTATLERILGAAGERLHLSSAPWEATTLLTPDNTAWETLESEKRTALRPEPGASVDELLGRGINLSRQAARLRRAVEGVGE